MVTQVADRQANRPGTRRALRARRASSGFASGPRMVAGGRVLIEDDGSAAAAEFPRGSRPFLTAGHDFEPGRPLPWCRPPQTAGRFDAEVRLSRHRAPVGEQRGVYETDPPMTTSAGFAIQTVPPLPITWAEHVASQGHWGVALREYRATTGTGFLPRRAVRVPGAAGEPGDARRGEGLPRAPFARFAYSIAITNRPGRGGAGRHGGHPARGGAATRSSHQARGPPGRRRVGWPRRAARGRRQELPASSRCQTCTINRRQRLPPRSISNPGTAIFLVFLPCFL